MRAIDVDGVSDPEALLKGVWGEQLVSGQCALMTHLIESLT